MVLKSSNKTKPKENREKLGHSVSEVTFKSREERRKSHHQAKHKQPAVLPTDGHGLKNTDTNGKNVLILLGI